MKSKWNFSRYKIEWVDEYKPMVDMKCQSDPKSKPTNAEIVLLQIGILNECESSVNFFSKVCELKLY